MSLAEGITHNTTLKALDLSGNSFENAGSVLGDAGASALGEMLAS